MKQSVYVTFSKLIDMYPSSVEADSELKRLAEIYAEYKAKKISDTELGWKIAFPIAKYPHLRKVFYGHNK